MRIELALYLGVFCLICQGCSPLTHAARTTIIQPTEYSRSLNDLMDCIRNNELAEAALRQFQIENAETTYSSDFCLGFKEGYADYLYAGGGGNPPPVPPRCYWKAKFETPEGRQSIQDWFAGFRQGAAFAKQSGYRELATLPSSLAPPSPPHLPPPPLPFLAPEDSPDDLGPLLDRLLPPPKKVPQ